MLLNNMKAIVLDNYYSITGFFQGLFQSFVTYFIFCLDITEHLGSQIEQCPTSRITTNFCAVFLHLHLHLSSHFQWDHSNVSRVAAAAVPFSHFVWILWSPQKFQFILQYVYSRGSKEAENNNWFSIIIICNILL